ncbi:MAG: hypothetical protein ACYDAR_06705 [Thermomicrobiales bacterium]
MADKPSPFTGLDKALLRSSKPQAPPVVPDEPVVQPVQPEVVIPRPEPETQPMRRPATTPRKREEKKPPKESSNHNTMVSRYQEEMIAAIRGAVRVVGKEAATYRFSPDEKARVSDIIYTYKRQGIRTSENEISRIALNFIFQDYEENGELSVLARVLDALNK